MRIFLVGPGVANYWTQSCQSALLKLGHAVYTFYYLEDFALSLGKRILRRGLRSIPSLSQFKARRDANKMNVRLYKEVAQYKPDLLLILKGETIYPEVIDRIKLYGKTIIASWWVDDPFIWWQNPPRLQLNNIKTLPLLDHLFIFDSYYVPKLKRMGYKNVHYLPLACDPDIYKSLNLGEDEKKFYGSDVCFVGTCFPEREKLFLELLDLGINFKIWGACWNNSRFKGMVMSKDRSAEEVAKIYNASSININVHHSQSVYSSNTRTFEVSACGTFQCTDKVKDLETLFNLGEELVCYEDAKDLGELIDYYLRHPEEKKTIARKGQKRVLRDHTYQRRMEKLINIICH